MSLRSGQNKIPAKAHLGGGPHVGDENGLRVERLVVQAIASVAVAAGSNFVEEGAVHAILQCER